MIDRRRDELKAAVLHYQKMKEDCRKGIVFPLGLGHRKDEIRRMVRQIHALRGRSFMPRTR